MSLPFTLEQFLEVFAAWNRAIWPGQLIATLLGVLACALLFRPGARADRIISGILALFWAVMAIGYHWMYFRTINPAASVFGALFLLQAQLFLVDGTIRGRIQFAFRAGSGGVAGVLLMAYALVIYPLVGLLLTHPWPQTPLFGVAPCPTTIFSLGLLLLARHPAIWLLAAVPVLWGAIGGSAAILLGVPQDYGLPVAAAAWLVLAFRNSPSRRHSR